MISYYEAGGRKRKAANVRWITITETNQLGGGVNGQVTDHRDQEADGRLMPPKMGIVDTWTLERVAVVAVDGHPAVNVTPNLKPYVPPSDRSAFSVLITQSAENLQVSGKPWLSLGEAPPDHQRAVCDAAARGVEFAMEYFRWVTLSESLRLDRSINNFHFGFFGSTEFPKWRSLDTLSSSPSSEVVKRAERAKGLFTENIQGVQGAEVATDYLMELPEFRKMFKRVGRLWDSGSRDVVLKETMSRFLRSDEAPLILTRMPCILELAAFNVGIPYERMCAAWSLSQYGGKDGTTVLRFGMGRLINGERPNDKYPKPLHGPIEVGRGLLCRVENVYYDGETASRFNNWNIGIGNAMAGDSRREPNGVRSSQIPQLEYAVA